MEETANNADAEAAAGSAPAPPMELPNPDVHDDLVPAAPLLPRIAHALKVILDPKLQTVTVSEVFWGIIFAYWGILSLHTYISPKI